MKMLNLCSNMKQSTQSLTNHIKLLHHGNFFSCGLALLIVKSDKLIR